MKRKLNNRTHAVAIVLAFVLFFTCVIGLHFAFPIDAPKYTEAEIRYLKDNGYLHDNFFEEIGHNVHNAWLNLQDLMKGGE